MDTTASAVPFDSTGPHGHRSRMRGRLLKAESALADYEVLEMLLFLGIPRRDTKPLAKSLVNRFGTLAGALTAAPAALAQAGLPPRAIEALGLVADAAGHLARPEARERVVLATWDALERHLDVPARTRQAPGVSAVLLNNRNQLLAEPCWPADVDAATLTTEMLRHALDRHATAVILVRNRGPAAPTLTRADRALHEQVQGAATALSVAVHDLIVLGRGDWISLRQRAGG